MAEAPAVAVADIPAVALRRAGDRRIRAEEVVALRMRRAAPRAQRPAVTTNVHRLRRARLGVVAAQRAAKLDRAKTELVTKLVGGLGEPFEFFAAVGFEQVQLFCAMGETGQGHTEKAHLPLRVAVFAEHAMMSKKLYACGVASVSVPDAGF